MPHHHFHLHNGHIDASDEEGLDLPDVASAERHAIEGIRGFLSGEVERGCPDLRGHIDVADATGAIVKTIRFADTVTILPR